MDQGLGTGSFSHTTYNFNSIYVLFRKVLNSLESTHAEIRVSMHRIIALSITFMILRAHSTGISVLQIGLLVTILQEISSGLLSKKTLRKAKLN